MKRICKHCNKEHELEYFVHYKNKVKHLVSFCDLNKSLIYLPFEKDLPIPTKFSRKFKKYEDRQLSIV